MDGKGSPSGAGTTGSPRALRLRLIEALVERDARAPFHLLGVAFFSHRGDLLGAHFSPSLGSVDGASLGRTIATLDSLLRDTFATLETGTLRAIQHDDFRIVVERGELAFLVILGTGTEDEAFRVLVRDMLTRLEDRNRGALLRERIGSGDLVGVDQGLEFFIRGPEIDMIVRGRA